MILFWLCRNAQVERNIFSFIPFVCLSSPCLRWPPCRGSGTSSSSICEIKATWNQNYNSLIKLILIIAPLLSNKCKIYHYKDRNRLDKALSIQRHISFHCFVMRYRNPGQHNFVLKTNQIIFSIDIFSRKHKFSHFF